MQAILRGFGIRIQESLSSKREFLLRMDTRPFLALPLARDPADKVHDRLATGFLRPRNWLVRDCPACVFKPGLTKPILWLTVEVLDPFGQVFSGSFLRGCAVGVRLSGVGCRNWAGWIGSGRSLPDFYFIRRQHGDRRGRALADEPREAGGHQRAEQGQATRGIRRPGAGNHSWRTRKRDFP